MRILLPLIALALLGLGFAFGALNPTPVVVDVLGVELGVRLGFALLLAALAGALGAGLLLAILVIWPLQRKLKRAGRGKSENGSGESAADA